MLKLINSQQKTARKVTNYQGGYIDFLTLANKLNLNLEPELSNGTVYATNESTDLAYKPNKDNPIRLTEWIEDY